MADDKKIHDDILNVVHLAGLTGFGSDYEKLFCEIGRRVKVITDWKDRSGRNVSFTATGVKIRGTVDGWRRQATDHVIYVSYIDLMSLSYDELRDYVYSLTGHLQQDYNVKTRNRKAISVAFQRGFGYFREWVSNILRFMLPGLVFGLVLILLAIGLMAVISTFFPDMFMECEQPEGIIMADKITNSNLIDIQTTWNTMSFDGLNVIENGKYVSSGENIDKDCMKDIHTALEERGIN
jgi:hypothetical protein